MSLSFNKIEEFGKGIFAKNPQIRKVFKRAYQLISVMISKERFKVVGDFKRITPKNQYEYFFGYYDKSPWDLTDRYLIALRVKNTTVSPAPKQTGTVVLIDTKDNSKEIEIAKTDAWNSQQGCMAQWLGPDFENRIIYNDFRDEKFVSVIYDIKKMQEEKVFDMAVYDVSKNGDFALSLNFSRLHRLRPGYGYSNIPDQTISKDIPNEPCMWRIELNSGEIIPLFTYKDFYSFETRAEMKKAQHKINHIMINPSGIRAMVLHRWILNGERFSRLVTFNPNGGEMFNLLDDNFVSHSFWKNDDEIITFARVKEVGKAYFILKDLSHEYKKIWPQLETDGHMSYSFSGDKIVTDTYPNRKRIASLFVNTENEVNEIGRVYAPFKYDNEVRCDLHPRFSHKEDRICIDSAHEGKRGIYEIKVPKITSKDHIRKQKIPKIIHTVWLGKNEKTLIGKHCADSWSKYCSDYKIIEWNEDRFDIKSSCKYVKEAYQAKKYAFVSDYIRLKALYEYGGLYFDSDFEVLKNIDSFLSDSGFLCIESKYTISTAIIASAAKAKWVKELLDEYAKLSFLNKDGSYNQFPNTKRIQAYLEKKYQYKWSNYIQELENNLRIYPSEYFSPLNCYTGVLKKTANTHGIHHYDNTWKSKQDKIKKKVMQLTTRVIGEDNRARLVGINSKN